MTDARRSSVDPATRVDYAALPSGAVVGRYEVVRVLGHGSFGITYLARDTRLGREVAIKEYLPGALVVRQDGSSVVPRSAEAADDFGWGRTRFIEEGRTLATLQEAPSIVEVFDFLEANGTAYIVMELLRGRTLADRVRDDGPMSQAELEAIVWPLLDGLQQVHEAGFLHRDIKPANIMLGAHNKATLIDFGASRMAMADRTRTMTAIFTPGYAAPEQFSSARQGPWTDVYGLAATLHYAITGKSPPNAFDRLMNDTYEPLVNRQPPTISRSLLTGIDAALSIRAEERPQSIADWRALLRRRAPPDDQTVLMRRQPIASRPLSASRTGRQAGWLAVAAALMLLGAGGYYVWTALPSRGDATRQALQEAEAGRRAAEALAEQLKIETARRAAEDAARRKTEASAAQAQQAAAAEAQAKQEAETRSKAEEQARTVRPPPPDFDGTYSGNLSERSTVGRVMPITLQLAGPAVSGQIVYQRCPAVPVTLAVSPSGEISGNVRLPDAMACALTNAVASGRVTSVGLQLDLRGPGVAAGGTLTRRGESLRLAAPASGSPVAAAGVIEGAYSGSLSSSAAAGGHSGSRPLSADLRVSQGRLTGQLVHSTCGATPVSLPVDTAGVVSGTLRLHEANGCAMIDAAASGTVTANAVTLDIRSVSVRARGSLSRRAD